MRDQAYYNSLDKVQKAVYDCVEMVHDHFLGDRELAKEWFNTPNPGLGGLTPMIMIRKGQHAKLKKFLKSKMLEGGL